MPPAAQPTTAGLALRNARRRRRWRRRALLTLGAVLGATCPHWPEPYGVACLLVASLAKVLHGQ